MAKLTANAVRAAMKAGERRRIADGGNLYLFVTGPGAAKWTLRYALAGKAREMGLGVADPDGRDGVTLAEARDRAADAMRLLRGGKDPIEARREAEAEAVRQRDAARTFREAAEHYIATHKAGWRSARHAAQWRATLAQHVHPIIGNMPVAAIGTADVERVLAPIWTKTPTTASRVRGRIENILDSAAAAGWRDPNMANPARWKGHLATRLPKPRKVAPVVHHSALPWQQVPGFLAALAEHDGMVAKTLRFAILTAARSGEVRGMRWGEVDMDGAVWVVPGQRIKGRKRHRVPLSDAALAVLHAVRPEKPAADAVVFPGPLKGKAMDDKALSLVVHRMCRSGDGEPPRWRDEEGKAIVPHGFRSAFKGWSLAKGYPDPLSELALAHKDANAVRAAYAREDMFEERRPMMEAWAEFCTRPPANVVALAGRRPAAPLRHR